MLSNVKTIGVLDRSMSYGAFPPLYSEIINALYTNGLSNKVQSYVYGLGGREITEAEIEDVFKSLLAGNVDNKIKYIGCRGC